ncbi:acyl-CoA thioesterase [Daejeonella lutea]|uniref:Acyl-CoA thioester hydrolase n=1 Tax=Daejeonella lutea TaxID=572036 RepID=A0A1T5B721_9SPHI|nr:thioesterase family protein [Daejeonella lutea]SKB42673.1 acyl-CoA thioester hydrolase [Daejeonella lutea]
MCTIDGYNYKTSIPIRFADIDAFGHVNNATYLTYFEIARSIYWKEIIRWDWKQVGIIVRKSEIEYLKPITLHDEIYAYVRTSRIGNSSFDVEYILVKKVNGKEEICTTGLTSCVTYDYNQSKTVAIPAYQRNKMKEFEAINVLSPEFQA